MDFIIFNLVSIFENIVVFCLMFALFRFKVKEYFIHIVFASFLMTQFSYYMRTVYDLGSLVPLFSLIMLFLMMWVMFRVPFHYAGIMSLVAFTAYSSIQAIFVLFQLYVGTLEAVEPFTKLAYLNQIASAIIALGISATLQRQRIGFTFVPFDVNVRLSRKKNISFLTILAILIILTGMNYYWFFLKVDHIYLTSTLFFVSLCILLYVSLRKEKLDD